MWMKQQAMVGLVKRQYIGKFMPSITYRRKNMTLKEMALITSITLPVSFITHLMG